MLFAEFRTGGNDPSIPPWSASIFDPERPGSFSHFYDTMSFGQLQVRGEVAPRRYRSRQPAADYISADPSQRGAFDRFSTEILSAADRDIDFSRYDNDGPDGIPDSGDDDGEVDALFLVLDSIPANFLLGRATGISTLGFESPFATDDIGADGQAIRIAPDKGTIQGGSTFAEVVGTICHEYGHILGLPDIFNTDFIQRGDPTRPEDDSAGIGAWGLMGWGALGWNGDDGPNSFCAWSRMRLGWAQVAEPGSLEDQMALEDVGARGALYKVPLSRRELFLMEYRRRQSSYYDRNLPGEGLLIWHAEISPFDGHLITLDLECADGLWRDAGFPQGREEDAVEGEDNLDFWAGNAAYRTAHSGNLGDATDPFDGRAYRAFTLETNPASYSKNGLQFVHVENIRFADDQALADIHFIPILIEAERVGLVDADGDQRAVAGEEIQPNFQLRNTSGRLISGLQARLTSDDPHVEITADTLTFGDLGAGERIMLNTEKLSFRFTDGFFGTHSASFDLEIRDREGALTREQFSILGHSPRRRVIEMAVIDSSGNGDGQAQVGEFVRLRLGLDASSPILPVFEFDLRPLDEAVRMSPRSAVRSEPGNDGQAHYVSSPEYLVPGTLDPGARLHFELEIASPFSTWRDTLALTLAAGEDQTAPRVGFAQIQFADGDAEITLPLDRILEGGPLRRVEALIIAPEDTTLLATVPLQRDGDAYRGRWTTDRPGRFWVQVIAEDQAGNRGLGELASFSTSMPSETNAPPIDLTDAQADGLPGWTWLGPRNAAWREPLLDLALAPSDPRIAYALTTQGLWRSLDRMQTWQRTGLMLAATDDLPVDAIGIAVDGQAPLTLYFERRCPDPERPCAPTFAKSTNGGTSWQTLPTPRRDTSEDLLAVDPIWPGRLYLHSGEHLWISEDGGQLWRETDVVLGALPDHPGRVVPHQTTPDTVYAISRLKDLWHQKLWRSADRGRTWEIADEGFGYPAKTLALDPQNPSVLYCREGFVTNNVFMIVEGGSGVRKWIGTALNDEDENGRLIVGPQGAIFSWLPNNMRKLYPRGRDEVIDLPFTGHAGAAPTLRNVLFHPQTPSLLYLLPAGPAQQPWISDGGGWQEVLIERGVPPVGSLWLGPEREIVAATGRVDADGRRRPALLASDDQGRTWRERPIGIPMRDVVFDALFRDPQAPEFALAYSDGLFHWSTDGGSTWRRILSAIDPPAQRAGFRPDFLPDPHRPGVYYVADRLLHRSEDFGTTWEQRSDGLPLGEGDAFAIDPDRPDALYAVSGDQVWRSANGGLAWAPAGTVAPGEPLLHLAINPRDGQALYAASRRSLYRSEDRGASWRTVLEAGTEPWERPGLHFDPNNSQILYFVTGHQLFRSVDQGDGWRLLSRGGWPWINDVAVDPTDPATVYVATAQGIYRIDAESTTTAVAEGLGGLPEDLALEQNFPNPFNSQTAIRFALPQRGKVELSVYNISGQKIAVLVDGVRDAGHYAATWDGKDGKGATLASGIYLYRLRAAGRSLTQKLLLLR